MDHYDQCVAYLTEHPEQIDKAWANPTYAKGGPLFKFASGSGDVGWEPDSTKQYGCLTMIRSRPERYVAETPELTSMIAADTRIPVTSCVGVESLPVFAAWQRHLDRELGRTTPAINDDMPMDYVAPVVELPKKNRKKKWFWRIRQFFGGSAY